MNKEDVLTVIILSILSIASFVSSFFFPRWFTWGFGILFAYLTINYVWETFNE